MKRFTIEYYPETGRYYPKYGDNYLDTRYMTGITEEVEDYLFAFADYSTTEKGAKRIIELFKEQQLKENVRTILVDDDEDIGPIINSVEVGQPLTPDEGKKFKKITKKFLRSAK